MREKSSLTPFRHPRMPSVKSKCRSCLQLRAREYRTLHQLQADVELICTNATTFNNKVNKVYKNAQAMLRGCRKHFLSERPLLLEAVAALHPGGPQVPA